jgi:hypothetical protein
MRTIASALGPGCMTEVRGPDKRQPDNRNGALQELVRWSFKEETYLHPEGENVWHLYLDSNLLSRLALVSVQNRVSVLRPLRHSIPPPSTIRASLTPDPSPFLHALCKSSVLG